MWTLYSISSPDPPPIGQLQIDRFILPARVVEIRDGEAVWAEESGASTLIAKKQSISKTRDFLNRTLASGAFREDYVYIALDAAEFLVKADIGLVASTACRLTGLEKRAVLLTKPYSGPRCPSSEGSDLAEAPAGDYTSVCPLLEDSRLCSFSGTGGVPRTSGHIHDQ
jgi:hypothetical protein